MTNAAPQSASATQHKGVKPTIGTPDHLLNSDTAVTVNPFASPVVKESISFDRALCEFLKLHFHVHEAKAREWMSTADAKDSEALRFSKAVHQAENAHWNQLGQFRGHFAVWHADPLYMRAYEAWPDLSMHERYSRLKMALGPVSTPFNFTGTIDEAIAALEKFILTGEIPKPAPPSPALVAACKNDEISRRSAALEKAFEKPDVVHGPVKVAAQKMVEPGETVVKLTDETPPEDDDDDLDDWFPRDDPTGEHETRLADDAKVNAKPPADDKPEHWSQTARFNKALTAIQNKNEASRILKTSVFRDFAHNECEVISFKDLPNTPDAEKHSLETIEQSADLKYGPKKDKPMPEKTMENTAPATAAPAKPNDAPAGKAEPQTVAKQSEHGSVTTTVIVNGFQMKVTCWGDQTPEQFAGNVLNALAGLRLVAADKSVKTFGTIADGRDAMTIIKQDGEFLSEPLTQRVSAPMQNAQTGGSTAPAPVSADSGSAACMMIKVGKTYKGDKDQLAFDCEGFEDPLKYSSKDSGAFLKIVAGLRKSDGSAITPSDLSQGNKFTVRGKVQWRKSEDGKYTNVVGTEAA